MLHIFRLDIDDDNNILLTPVESCAIQGDRIPAVADKYANILFHLQAADGRVSVRHELCDWIPDEVIRKVEDFVNGAEDMRALPTYIHDQMLLNGVDLVPRLHLAYIAESEQAVRDFIDQ